MEIYNERVNSFNLFHYIYNVLKSGFIQLKTHFNVYFLFTFFVGCLLFVYFF